MNVDSVALLSYNQINVSSVISVYIRWLKLTSTESSVHFDSNLKISCML